jgi:predicted Ser/Thr protein kinase
MAVEMSFDRALGAVADGQDVDWDAVERVARDEAERERVRCLRLLGEIGELHRTTVDPTEEPPRAIPPPPASISRLTRAPARRRTAERPPPRPRPGVDRKASLFNSMADTLDGASGPTSAPRWGRYHLVEKVGTGGFGQVYRAWDPELERELAIKILHAHIADGSSRERLRHEGRALARIRQANVVNVLGVEVQEGRAALCMEFVRGQTLDELVHTRGTYSAREAVLIGEDVCRALAAVHRAGYLHRDVKAKNVMREQAGRIVLMDFGTGREEQSPGRVPGGDMTGTPLYMAPEVLAGRPASMRSDVYSVGVLLFHLVSGGYPLQARSTSELKAAHREGRRRFLGEWRSDLPAAFVRVVDRALAPAPEDRYPNAAALLEALGGVLGDDDEDHVARSWMPKGLRQAITALPFVGLGLIALGALTSVAFNNTLGRGDYSGETVADWVKWGLKSNVLPVFLLLVGYLAPLAVGSVWKLLSRSSSWVARLDARLGLWLQGVARDPVSLASVVVLVSTAALLIAWVRFWSLLQGLSTSLAFGSPEQLQALSPAFQGEHDLYRLVFSLMTIATLVAWFVLSKLAAQVKRPLPRGAVLAGMAVVCLQLGCLSISYRLLIHNQFEVAQWRGQTCYVIGRRSDRLLVSCPGAAPPRNTAVSRTDPQLELTGRREGIFTRLPVATSPD